MTDPTWDRIATCAATGHRPFWTSDPRPHEDTCTCGAIVRTVTTAEGWGEHAAEMRADDTRLRWVDDDRAADTYYARRWA